MLEGRAKVILDDKEVSLASVSSPPVALEALFSRRSPPKLIFDEILSPIDPRAPVSRLKTIRRSQRPWGSGLYDRSALSYPQLQVALDVDSSLKKVSELASPSSRGRARIVEAGSQSSSLGFRDFFFSGIIDAVLS